MANAYSHLGNYEQEVYTPDLKNIERALNYKQGKLDYNRAALQKAYDDTIGSLDLLKDEDKKYATERVAAVTDLVNQYAAQDLSNDGLYKALKADTSQILDANVKNALVSTATYRAEQAAWKKLKEESPEKYADVNYAYSQQNAQDYLSDGTVGSKYKGGGSPIAFTDVQAKLNEALPKFLKERGIEERIDYNTGTKYYWDKKTEKHISKELVMQGININLNPQDRAQLGINAWGDYSKEDPGKINSMYKNRINDKVKKVDSSIEYYENFMSLNSTSQDEKEQAKNIIGKLKNQRNDYTSVLNQDIPTESAYNQMYLEDFTNRFADAYSVFEVTKIDRQKNEVAFKELDHAFTMAEKAQDQTNKLEILTTEALLDAQAKQITPGKTGSDSSLSGTSSADDYNPTAMNFIETKHTTETSGYTKVTEELKTNMSKVSDFYEGLTGSEVEKKQAKKEIMSFTGQKLKNSYNEADGTFEYVVGMSIDGQPITKRFTEDQAASVYAAKSSLRKTVKANQVVTEQFKKDASKVANAVIESDDFDYNDLPDFNIAVSSSGGNKRVFFKPSTNFKTYAQLMQAKHDGVKLTEDEEATLMLYNQLEHANSVAKTSKGWGVANPNTSEVEAIDMANTFINHLATEYEDGDKFLPKSVEVLGASTEYETFQPKHVDFKEGLNQAGAINTILLQNPKTVQALELVSNHYFEGKLVMNQSTSAPTLLGGVTRDQVVTIDPVLMQLAGTIAKNSSDVNTYVLSNMDDKLMNSVTTSGIRGVQPSTGIFGASDNSFYAAGEGDLEKDVDGFFDKNTLGGSYEAFATKSLESISKNIEGLTSDYNKAPQDYSMGFGPEKVQLRTDINRILMNTATEGESTRVQEGGNFSVNFNSEGQAFVYGEMETFNAEKGKYLPSPVTKDQGIPVTKEELDALGIRKNEQPTSGFNLANKEPLSEIQNVLVNQNNLEDFGSMLNNQINMHQSQGGQVVLDDVALNNYASKVKKDVKVELLPKGNTYVVELSIT